MWQMQGSFYTFSTRLILFLFLFQFKLFQISIIFQILYFIQTSFINRKKKTNEKSNISKSNLKKTNKNNLDVLSFYRAIYLLREFKRTVQSVELCAEYYQAIIRCIRIIQIIILMNDQAIKQCKSILKKNHLHPLRRIGKGAFASVFLVEKIQLQKNQNQLYSVKCINKKQILKRPSLNKYIKQQIEILRNIKNQHIVRSYRTFQDDGWIFMVMEYCDQGNLNSKVTQSQGSLLTLQETFHITYQIIQGLDYMHSKNLIHRDIKAQNILLSSKQKSKTKVGSKKTLTMNHNYSNNYDYIVKICDLGFTTQQDQSVNTFCGTTCYMAPEIFKKTNYDNKVDIWALGVLIYFMLFGSFPFQGLNIQYQIEKKCEKGFNLSQMNVKLNQSISKQNFKLLEDFFRKIFASNPQARMTLDQLQAVPWIKRPNNINNTVNIVNTVNTTMPTQKKDRQKTRIDTEKQEKSTTNQSDQSEDQIKNKRNFDIEKYYFIKDIIEEVENHKFLKSSEEIAFKYYMLKMIHHQFSKVLKVLNLKEELDKLQSTLQNSSKMLVNNIKKINIPKLSTLFNPKAKQFNQFKQPYRLVIGHVFSKAHKNITEDIQLRSQLKLKLFICHVINRVFQMQQNQGIFVHYEKWNMEKKIKNFSFKTFSKWISQEQGQKLVETIQLMNSKFYKSK